eukprot:TRINITY_DN11861_c0_g1_i1.p1 TRINITY_DN11861_c0_g1~~TRINITY_DN11861_c0_g1_i1.p1  ORF type:complete len:480 (-),score=157.79 TRINITY_DN11861_c0_g1_i1:261-1700(-)
MAKAKQFMWSSSAKFHFHNQSIMSDIKLKLRTNVYFDNMFMRGEAHFPAVTRHFWSDDYTKHEYQVEDQIRSRFRVAFPKDYFKQNALENVPIGHWWKNPMEEWVQEQSKLMKEKKLSFNEGWNEMIRRYREKQDKTQLAEMYNKAWLEELGFDVNYNKNMGIFKYEETDYQEPISTTQEEVFNNTIPTLRKKDQLHNISKNVLAQKDIPQHRLLKKCMTRQRLGKLYNTIEGKFKHWKETEDADNYIEELNSSKPEGEYVTKENLTIEELTPEKLKFIKTLSPKRVPLITAIDVPFYTSKEILKFIKNHQQFKNYFDPQILTKDPIFTWTWATLVEKDPILDYLDNRKIKSEFNKLQDRFNFDYIDEELENPNISQEGGTLSVTQDNIEEINNEITYTPDESQLLRYNFVKAKNEIDEKGFKALIDNPKILSDLLSVCKFDTEDEKLDPNEKIISEEEFSDIITSLNGKEKIDFDSIL